MSNSGSSNWWWGVALLLVLEVIGYVAIGALLLLGELRGPLPTVPESGFIRALLVGGGAVGGLVVFGLSTPFFALFLFLDARKLTRKEALWTPNPYLWGAIGLIPLLATIVYPLTSGVMVPIGLVYLGLRWKRIGLFLPRVGRNHR